MASYYTGNTSKKNKTYYDPQNGQQYYHGETLRASNYDAPEVGKQSYINPNTYTPDTYTMYQQYLRQMEEEERKRREQQQMQLEQSQKNLIGNNAISSHNLNLLEQKKDDDTVNALNEKIDKRGNLTANEEVAYSNAKVNQAIRQYDGLSDLLRQREGIYSELNADKSATDRNRDYNPLNFNARKQKEDDLQKSLDDITNQIRDVVKDDNVVNDILQYADRVQDRTDTINASNIYKINENDSALTKVGKGIRNTIASLGNDSAYGNTLASKDYMNSDNKARGLSGNTDSWMGRQVNMANAAREEVSNNINSGLGGFLYDTAYSSMDSLKGQIAAMALQAIGIPAPIVQAVTVAPFGAKAFNSEYKNARANGATEEEAKQLASGSAAIEMGTELIPMGNILKTAGGKGAATSLISSALKQMAEEGAEEGVGNVLNEIYNALVLSDDEEVQSNFEKRVEETGSVKAALWDFAKETGIAMASGALSAAPGGASAYSVGRKNANAQEVLSNAIKDKFSSVEVDDSTDYGKQMKADAEKYGSNPAQYFADQYDPNAIEKTEHKTKIGELIAEKQRNKTIEERKEVKNNLDEIAKKEARGEALTKGERNYIIENVGVDSGMLEEILGRPQGSNVPNEFRQAKTNATVEETTDKMIQAARTGNTELLAEAYQNAKNSRIAEVRDQADEILNSPIVSGQIQSKGVTADMIESIKLTQEDSYLKGLNGEEVEGLSERNQFAYNKGVEARIEEERKTTIKSADEFKNAYYQTKDGSGIHLAGTFTNGGLRTTDNKIVSIEDLDLSNESAISKALVMADNYDSVDTKNVFLKGIGENTNISDYSKAFKVAYEAGQDEISWEKAKESASVSVLGNNLLKSAWKAGAEDKQIHNRQYGKNNLAKAVGIVNSVNPGVVDISETTKFTDHSNEVQFFDTLANNTGLNFKISDDYNFRGQYNAKDNTIYLRSDSLKTVFHELGEFAKQYNNNQMLELKGAVSEVTASLIGVDGFNEFKKSYTASYGKVQNDVSSSEMSDEMLFDALATIMSGEYGQSAMAAHLVQNYDESTAKRIGRTIKEFFETLIDGLKKIVSGSDHDSNYQKFIEQNISQYEKFANDFIDLINNTIAAKNQLVAEGKDVTQDQLDELIKSIELTENDFDEKGNIIESTSDNVEAGQFSIDTTFEALGLTFQKDGARTVALDANGKEVTHLTPEMVDDTPWGAIIREANTNGFITKGDVKKQQKFVADLINQMLTMQDIDLVWAVNSVIGYQPIDSGERTEYNKNSKKNKTAALTTNADPQYSTTVDFGTICLKTQAVIDVMSETMKRLGRGLTEDEIVNIVYKNTHKAGEPVPCPVCYVFSRWVGLGGLFDKMNRLQDTYKVGTDMSVIKKEMSNLEKEISKMSEELGIRRSKSKDILYNQIRKEFDILDASKKYNKLSKKDEDRYEKLTRQKDLLEDYAWFEKVRLKNNYKPVPKEILFDINAGNRFAAEYPTSWAYRTSRGPSMGKAATPYVDEHIGQVVRGINAPSSLKKNLGNVELDPFLYEKVGDEYQQITDGKMRPNAVRMVKSAIKNQKRQNLMNGNRYQSTSDYRFEYGLDYLMTFFEMQAIGAKVQLYTKVPESVIMNATVNAEVNCSLMPLGKGYEIDKDGNVNLLFSAVTGMHPDDAFTLSAMFDNVQPILVGVNNTQIKAAFNDSRITFIIPYHASESTEQRYIDMMKAVQETVADRTDYSSYQSDVVVDNSKENVRELRKKILTGKADTLNKEEKKLLNTYPMLNDLYRRFYVEGVDDDCRYTDSEGKSHPVALTTSQANVIMPHEFWDKNSTIETADINTQRFEEYLDMLGMKPRFSGYDSKGKYNAEFDLMHNEDGYQPGYWKVIPDRSMYNLDGTYHNQKPIDVSNYRMEFLDKTESDKGIVKPSQVNDKTKVNDITEQSIKDINEKDSAEKLNNNIKDIRNALDVEEEFMTADDVEEKEFIDTTSSILEEGMKLLKGKEVDNTKLRSVALSLRKEFNSSYNVNDFADKLQKAFAYMQSQEHVDYKTMMGILRDIARPVIDQSTQKEDATDYNNLKNALKGKKIKLSDRQIAEVAKVFGSYGNFTKKMMPITFSKNGDTLIKDVWAELNTMYPDMFDMGTSEEDMALVLADRFAEFKPSSKNIYGADTEEMSRNLAMRIVEEYVGGTVRTKMSKQIDDYLDHLKKQNRERLAKAKTAQNQKLAARSRDRYMKAKDRQLANEQKKIIGKLTNQLVKWIDAPNENNHVPTHLAKPILEFVSAFDFVTPEITRDEFGVYHAKVWSGVMEGSRPKWENFKGNSYNDIYRQIDDFYKERKGSEGAQYWMNKMRGIEELLNKAKNHEDFNDSTIDNLIQSLDPELGDMLADVINRNKEIRINNLSSEDLKVLTRVMKGIMHAVRVGNKAYTQKATIDGWAQKTIDNSKKIRTKNHTAFVNAVLKNFVVDAATPETFFALQGEAGDEIFTSLENGFETKLRDIQATQKFMEEALEGIDKKKLREMHGSNSTIYSIDVGTGTLELNKAQIMSLYVLNKRNQATLHYAGGIKADTILKKEKGIRKQQNQTDPLHLTGAEINRVIDLLSDSEKELADKMQQFMADECAKWGNEASKIMYDYEKFTDPNYFPITTDSNTHAMNNQNTVVDSINGVERMGFTKQVNQFANNALVIRDIFDVFIDHTTNMATYHGLAPAIKDSNRWFNYKFKEDIGNGWNKQVTVQQAVNTNMGRTDKAGTDYYKQFVQDMNRKEKSNDITLAGYDELFGAAKGVAIGGNLRVVVQQPTAILRAMNEIDPKYLLANSPKAVKALGKAEMDRIKEASPLAWYKSQGYYETSMGKSMDTILTGQQTVRDKAIDASMALAGKADDITWAVIYNAVENEQRDKLKGTKFTEEEYRKAVNERFNRIVSRTQVVDATLQKSQWMRKGGIFTKISTSFMAEPIKSYNLAMKAVLLDIRDGKLKRTPKALVVLAITSIANGFAKSLIDALRHKDDDDEYWETVLEYFKKNWASDLNILGMIPGLDDAVSSLYNSIMDERSYSSGSDSMVDQSMQTIGKALNTSLKLAKGEEIKTNGYGTYMIYAKALSLITRVPLGNLSRDMAAIYNLFADSEHRLTTAIKNPSDYVNDIKDDIADGNIERIEEDIDKAVEAGVTQKDVDSKLNNYYKNQYKKADDSTRVDIENMVKPYYINVKGMTEDEVNAMFDGWLQVNPSISDADDAISTGEGIEEATKKLLDYKGVDKADEIYEHWINEYGSTIERERENNLGTSYEDNLNKAIQTIDPTMNYDSVKAMLEGKAEEKAQAREASEALKSAKAKVFNTDKDGAARRSGIRELIALGKDNSDIQDMISKEYHERWKNAESVSEKNAIRSEAISAYKIKDDEIAPKDKRDTNYYDKMWDSWEDKQN